VADGFRKLGDGRTEIAEVDAFLAKNWP